MVTATTANVSPARDRLITQPIETEDMPAPRTNRRIGSCPAAAAPYTYVPVSRLLPLLERACREEDVEPIWISRRLGLDESRLRRALKQERVTVDWLDRLLVVLELQHFLYLPPEQGGFSDIYFHDELMQVAA